MKNQLPPEIIKSIAQDLDCGMNCIVNLDTGEYETLMGESYDCYWDNDDPMREEVEKKIESWGNSTTIEPPHSGMSFRFMEQFVDEAISSTREIISRFIKEQTVQKLQKHHRLQRLSRGVVYLQRRTLNGVRRERTKITNKNMKNNPNAELNAQLQQYIEEKSKRIGRDASSLEELNLWVAEFMQGYNSREMRDFGGYSPNTMSIIIRELWDEQSPVKLKRLNPDDFAELSMFRQLERF